MAAIEDHVRGGMEVLNWEYDSRGWRELLNRRRKYLDRDLATDIRAVLGRPTHVEARALLDELERRPLSSVRFTSTGVITDYNVCSWYYKRQRLEHLQLISAGWDVLLMRFSSRWFWGTSTTIVIPVPEKLLDDVRELYELLEHKVRNPDATPLKRIGSR